MAETLALAFEEYLQSNLERTAAMALIDALKHSALADEALALDRYLRGDESEYCLMDDLWKDHRCFAGAQPPRSAKPGDIWFDIVELTPMVLLRNLPGTSVHGKGWIALHPVYAWQFKAFMALVQVEDEREIFKVPDIYQADRLVGTDDLSYITNIYHDEAMGYGLWFGKIIVEQPELQAARLYLAPEKFARILPSFLRLWEFADSYHEMVRSAIGTDTLDKEVATESYLHHIGANRDIPDRMLYDERERYDNIGETTWLAHDIGMRGLGSKPYDTIFFHIGNSAPRPKRVAR
jgi:hypothetical protein